MSSHAARVQQVTREDLVLFINACFACTRQQEFYSLAQDQAVSIGFLHEYIAGNYRRLYARTLAAGINHYNQAQIVLTLLRTGRETPASFRDEENRLIRAALRALPPQRVFRLFKTLRTARVNNRRTRAVIRSYLRDRPDPSLDAVKYRSKVRHAVAHAHLALPGETGTFLFDAKSKKHFETPLFDKYRQAHYSQEAMYELPFTVAEGFAHKHGVPRDVFLRKIEPRMTQAEKLRLQRVAETTKGVSLDLDLGRVGLTKLALYLLSLDPAEREAKRETFETALDQSANRALKRAPSRLGKVAAVLDRSYSSSGSTEKRRRPLGVALAAGLLLERASREYRSFWTPHHADPLLVTPTGQTNLADPVLDAIEWGAEMIVIVSDGYENDPPATVAQLIDAYRGFEGARDVAFVHVNPVFDATNYAPKGLGPSIPTVGVRDAEDLPTMLAFARFADARAELSELEDYLGFRARAMLDAADGSGGGTP